MCEPRECPFCRGEVAEGMREMAADGISFNGMDVAEIIGVDYDDDEACWRRLAELVDAGLSDDDREALRWVRDHGGLDALRRRVDVALARETVAVGACSLLGMSDDSDARDVMHALESRLMPDDGCGVHGAAGIMLEYRRVLNGVCKRLGLTDGTGKPEQDGVIYGELEKRLMPEGYEWPHYEDDEPVRIDDVVLLKNDLEEEVHQIFFHPSGFELYTDTSEVDYSYGERVKRPRPKVFASDGEPLEVGQTVWSVSNGIEFTVVGLPNPGEYQSVKLRLDDGAFTGLDPDQLTHQRPVLDADGNRIETGMDVWWVCEGDERGIHAERLHVESIEEDGTVECSPHNGGTSVVLDPAELYVRKPVLDADGVPIKVGDTVYLLPGDWCDVFPCLGYHGGEELEVFSLHVDGKDGCVGCHDTRWPRGTCYPQPSQLTHERPDSWALWRNDLEGMHDPRLYCRERGIGGDGDDIGACACLMADDMERRARALAEREMGE